MLQLIASVCRIIDENCSQEYNSYDDDDDDIVLKPVFSHSVIIINIKDWTL